MNGITRLEELLCRSRQHPSVEYEARSMLITCDSTHGRIDVGYRVYRTIRKIHDAGESRMRTAEWWRTVCCALTVSGEGGFPTASGVFWCKRERAHPVWRVFDCEPTLPGRLWPQALVHAHK